MTDTADTAAASSHADGAQFHSCQLDVLLALCLPAVLAFIALQKAIVLSQSCFAVLARQVRVAVIREEGSNGDREMAAAVYAAGMEPWDITMSDLIAGRAQLDSFRGIIFVGGFSYADVLDSAKGWAGTIKFNNRVLKQFQEFYNRSDTFSLGICNGCQLMALLGWVPATANKDGGVAAQLQDLQQPRFVHNKSGR